MISALRSQPTRYGPALRTSSLIRSVTSKWGSPYRKRSGRNFLPRNSLNCSLIPPRYSDSFDAVERPLCNRTLSGPPNRYKPARRSRARCFDNRDGHLLAVLRGDFDRAPEGRMSCPSAHDGHRRDLVSIMRFPRTRTSLRPRTGRRRSRPPARDPQGGTRIGSPATTAESTLIRYCRASHSSPVPARR